jgi:3-hydroxyacyl-CoA dehydrogenase
MRNHLRIVPATSSNNEEKPTVKKALAMATRYPLYESLRDAKYCSCPLLEKMVAANWLGRKTGRGFYEYGKQ